MYAATYLVTSKKIDFKHFSIDTSLGYAFDFLDLETKDFRGFFGGAMFTPNFYDLISFSIEHNSMGVNSGLKWNPFKPIILMIGVWDLNKPTFSFNYLF